MTREGKPFCSEHVEKHPYVQNVLKQLDTRDAEDAAVLEKGESAANLAGITAHELLQQLELNGPRTVQRLARELNIDHKIVTGYVNALSKRGLVETDLTRRGSTVVMIAEHLLKRSAEPLVEDDDD